ncbi:MAG: hypothetical protein NW220_12655 [Leptolyngbyaceae cyanobacterium bins.349]|nr:hypothetical protein [Leptolyngbyaceae cyanobacterium bins.349]
MQNVNVSRSNWSVVVRRLGAALAGASLAVGAVVAEMLPATAVPQTPSTSSVTLPDGVYLYGESTQPDELGKGYFVFESKQGQVVGALYLPRSSFDCAAGSFKQEQLALTVTNSYDRLTNPLEIALDRTSTVASSGNPALGVGLQGFHKLDTVTENDLRMLNVCKDDLQGQAKAAR